MNLQYLYHLAACTNPYGIQLPCRDSSGNPVGTIIKVVVATAASVSILFVVIGGFRYVISSGDPANITKAKNTIIYALIGLAVSVTAYGIVSYVINAVGS